MTGTTMQQLRDEVEMTALEANCKPTEIISAMQTACARMGEEAILEMLCELKWEYIN